MLILALRLFIGSQRVSPPVANLKACGRHLWSPPLPWAWTLVPSHSNRDECCSSSSSSSSNRSLSEASLHVCQHILAIRGGRNVLAWTHHSCSWSRLLHRGQLGGDSPHSSESTAPDFLRKLQQPVHSGSVSGFHTQSEQQLWCTASQVGIQCGNVERL